MGHSASEKNANAPKKLPNQIFCQIHHPHKKDLRFKKTILRNARSGLKKHFENKKYVFVQLRQFVFLKYKFLINIFFMCKENTDLLF